MRNAVLALWILAASIRTLAFALLLARKGAALRYWPVTIFFSVSTVRTAALGLSLADGRESYAAAWLAALPIGMAVDALLAAGAFHLMARELPKFYPWGWRVYLALAAISGLFVVAVSQLSPGRNSAAYFLPLVNSGAFWMLFLLFGMGWFWLFSGPDGFTPSPGALRNSKVTLAYFAVNLASLSLAQWSYWASQFTLQLGCLSCFFSWLLFARSVSVPASLPEEAAPAQPNPQTH